MSVGEDKLSRLIDSRLGAIRSLISGVPGDFYTGGFPCFQ